MAAVVRLAFWREIMDDIERLASKLKAEYGKKSHLIIDGNVATYRQGMALGGPYDSIEAHNELTRGLDMLTNKRTSKTVGGSTRGSKNPRGSGSRR
jgi:hypothetical protein